MNLITNYNNFKNTIIFIHGYNKDARSWNYDSKDKNIKIEEQLAKTRKYYYG